jgi:hypothetical protein
MLVLLHTVPLAYPPRRNLARCVVETTRFSLLRRSLWISSLYYTQAPQLLHVLPPTRAFSHTQDAPAAPSPHAPHNTLHLSHVPNLGVLNPWTYKLLVSSVVNLTLLLKPRRPFEPVKGAVDEISRFRPDRAGFTPRSRHPRPSNSWD